MLEWAAQALCKVDKLWQESQTNEADGLSPITLNARNSFGLFCSYITDQMDRYFVSDDGEGGIDFDVSHINRRFSIEFFPNGSYRWKCFLYDNEVVGGGENAVSREGVSMIFSEIKP